MLLLMAQVKCSAWLLGRNHPRTSSGSSLKPKQTKLQLPLSVPLDTTIFCARQPPLFLVRVVSQAGEVVSKKRNCLYLNTEKTFLFLNTNSPHPCSVIQAIPICSTKCTCPITVWLQCLALAQILQVGFVLGHYLL